MTSNEIEEFVKSFGPIKEIVPSEKSVRIITADGKVYEAPRKKDPTVLDLTWEPVWGVSSAMLPKEMQDWFKNFTSYYKKGDKLASALMKTSALLLTIWAHTKKQKAPVVVARQEKKIKTDGSHQRS